MSGYLFRRPCDGMSLARTRLTERERRARITTTAQPHYTGAVLKNKIIIMWPCVVNRTDTIVLLPQTLLALEHSCLRQMNEVNWQRYCFRRIALYAGFIDIIDSSRQSYSKN